MKALIVMDMQEVSVGENHHKMFHYDSSLLDNVNKVINDNKDNLVIYIRNMMKKNLINSLAPVKVYSGSKEAELAHNLLKVSDNVIDKYSGNAFSVDELIALLAQNRIDTVELVGIDGAGCVAQTALGALEKGYRVVINTSAVGTISYKKYRSCLTKLEKKGVLLK